jgi:hypothetical protein
VSETLAAAFTRLVRIEGDAPPAVRRLMFGTFLAGVAHCYARLSIAGLVSDDDTEVKQLVAELEAFGRAGEQ